ncbi:hypothetical protein [Serratia sp. NA_13]
MSVVMFTFVCYLTIGLPLLSLILLCVGRGGLGVLLTLRLLLQNRENP